MRISITMKCIITMIIEIREIMEFMYAYTNEF
jgi:hypothetical protein